MNFAKGFILKNGAYIFLYFCFDLQLRQLDVREGHLKKYLPVVQGVDAVHGPSPVLMAQPVPNVKAD